MQCVIARKRDNLNRDDMYVVMHSDEGGAANEGELDSEGALNENDYEVRLDDA